MIKMVCRCVAGRWTPTLVYRLPAQVKADNGVVVGVDRNGGQYAYAAGETGMVRQQKSKTLEVRRKRYQRKLARQQEAAKRRPKQRRSKRMEHTRRKLAKTERKIANRRKHDIHAASKIVAAIDGTAVMVESGGCSVAFAPSLSPSSCAHL